MNTARNAAPVKHHNDGPPRLNSTRCATYHNVATGYGQSSSGVARQPEGAKMNQEVVGRQEEFAIIEQVVMQGDLSKLDSKQRVQYYNKVCESAGLNPFTKPFAYLLLNGKLTLYATKDCTEQLRKINGVSIEGLDDQLLDDIYVVTAKAKDKTGRIDQSKGAVVIGHLKGEAKANAIMKCETKAKRRVTLSICGMGFIDESEVDSIPNAKRVDMDEIAPRITISQANDLEVILSECDETYSNWVYDYLKKQFSITNLIDVPVDIFERMKSAAVKNMEENHKRQRAAAVSLPNLTPEEPEMLAAEVR